MQDVELTMPRNTVRFCLTEKMCSKRILHVALAYAKAGIPVFPLKPKSKKPIFKGGYKLATTDPKKIRQWWKKYPDANIGSPLFKGLVALDFDGEEGIKTFESLDFNMPHIKVITPRGFHLYVIADLTSKNAVMPGLDIKGGGKDGYIVMPPSIHPSGIQYKWEV